MIQDFLTAIDTSAASSTAGPRPIIQNDPCPFVLTVVQ